MSRLIWLFRKTLLIEMSYKVNNVLRSADILVYVLVFYFLGGLVDRVGIPAFGSYGGQYFPFVLTGLVLSWYHNEAQQSFSANLRNEQILGTLEALVATGTPLSAIILGFSLFDFFMVTIQIGLLLFVAILFLGVHIAWYNLLLTVGIVILSIISFIGFGLASAAFVLIFKRGDPLGWIVKNLSLLIGGVYYPVEILPKGLQKLASFLPLTHSLRAVRAVVLNGAGISEVVNELSVLVIFCLVLLPASLLFFRHAVKKAVVDGTLAGH